MITYIVISVMCKHIILGICIVTLLGEETLRNTVLFGLSSCVLVPKDVSV